MNFKTTYDAKTKTWNGNEYRPLYDFNCSVGRIVYEQMKNWPNNVIQINDIDGRVVKNSEALTWSIRLAQHLRSLGITHKDVVGIIAKNSTYVMPLAVGCLMNATPFHTLNPTYDGKLIAHLLSITKPKIIFCDGSCYELVLSGTKDWRPMIFTFWEHLDGVRKIDELLVETEDEASFEPAILVEGGNQTMAILCSSGTTGLPKAVCISNSKLLFDDEVNNEDVLFSFSGLDWLSGIWQMMLSLTKGSTRIITNKPITAEYMAELLMKYKVTFTLTPPSVISIMVGEPELYCKALKTVRIANCGGSPFTPETLQRFLKLLPKEGKFFQCYGMTEVSIVARNSTQRNHTSTGMLANGVSACIVDDEGKRLGPNEQGELLIHMGQHKWNGYYNNREATEAIHSPDGWIASGDIAYFNEESFLYIVDRKKDILKHLRLQYWPSEIEAVIAELPAVVEVCVVGIYDERFGDVPGAIIRKLPDISLSVEEVQDHVAQRLAAFKRLNAGVVFVDRLPQNSNNKVLRRECKELFLKMISK